MTEFKKEKLDAPALDKLLSYIIYRIEGTESQDAKEAYGDIHHMVFELIKESSNEK